MKAKYHLECRQPGHRTGGSSAQLSSVLASTVNSIAASWPPRTLCKPTCFPETQGTAHSAVCCVLPCASVFKSASVFKCPMLISVLIFHVLLCILSVCFAMFFKCVKCVVVMFVVWHGLVCSSDQVIKLARGGVSVIIKVLLLSL